MENTTHKYDVKRYVKWKGFLDFLVNFRGFKKISNENLLKD